MSRFTRFLPHLVIGGATAITYYNPTFTQHFDRQMVAECMIDKKAYLAKKLAEVEYHIAKRWRDIGVGHGRVARPGLHVLLFFHAKDPRTGETFEKTKAPIGFVVGDPVVPPVVNEIVCGMREGGVREAICPPSMSHPKHVSKVLMYTIELVVCSNDNMPAEGSFERFMKRVRGIPVQGPEEELRKMADEWSPYFGKSDKQYRSVEHMEEEEAKRVAAKAQAENEVRAAMNKTDA